MTPLFKLITTLVVLSGHFIGINNTAFSGISDVTRTAFSAAVDDFEKLTNRLTIGDSVTVAGVTMTLKSVEYTNDRNQHEDEFEHVIEISFELENTTNRDYFTGSELSLYANNRMANYYILDPTVATLSPGRIIEAKQQFGFNGSTEQIEIEFRPDLYSDEYAIFYVDKSKDEASEVEEDSVSEESASKDDETLPSDSNETESNLSPTLPPAPESTWTPPVESKPEESWTPPPTETPTPPESSTPVETPMPPESSTPPESVWTPQPEGPALQESVPSEVDLVSPE